LANTLTGPVELKSILSISTIFIVIFEKRNRMDWPWNNNIRPYCRNDRLHRQWLEKFIY
jgi:hypothetical protein